MSLDYDRFFATRRIQGQDYTPASAWEAFVGRDDPRDWAGVSVYAYVVEVSQVLSLDIPLTPGEQSDLIDLLTERIDQELD